MSLQELGERAIAVDGVAPFNEASLLALRAGDAARVLVLRTDSDGALIAAAYASGDAPVEVVVAPDRRRAGIGRSIVDELLADGETRFWAHGDLPGARALAAAAGLGAARTLLVLRLEMVGAPAETVPDGITLRSYEPADADAVVEVNRRAFASHPEQGAMDRADFDRRTRNDWFDPAGLFVAERDGRIVGFHWTKVEDNLGEVYVVGIDPDAQGGGLGKALTARGLRHLWESGIRTVDLYVEGDNSPALAVYEGLGFRPHAKDVLYAAPELAGGHTHE
ncbi:mycothiol synthase [Aeromicrobium panaciterrae]|uniref:mycothiol synthase n=1 Tax=Aeromicrobium panaciterrae TaxID=363861 RepID=UPI0031E0481B